MLRASDNMPAAQHWNALLEATQQGDAGSYDTLLREALPMLRAIARRRLRHAAAAEDAVQDTLLTLHRLRHAYDPRRPAATWLAMLCERRCIDALRRMSRETAREAHAVPPEAAVTPEDAAQRHLALAELRAAIAALSPRQRLALQLTKLQELSLAEASARSGVSVGALKLATHRAVRRLRRQLGASDAAVA